MRMRGPNKGWKLQRTNPHGECPWGSLCCRRSQPPALLPRALGRRQLTNAGFIRSDPGQVLSQGGDCIPSREGTDIFKGQGFSGPL